MAKDEVRQNKTGAARAPEGSGRGATARATRSAEGEVAEGGCEGTPCRVVYVRTAWRKREGKRVQPTATNVTVIDDKSKKPPKPQDGMRHRLTAQEKIFEAFAAEEKTSGGKCPGDCACNWDEPADEDFVYSGWTIIVKFHTGGRDPSDPRVDYTATFEALRAEVVVWGDCVSGLA